MCIGFCVGGALGCLLCSSVGLVAVEAVVDGLAIHGDDGDTPTVWPGCCSFCLLGDGYAVLTTDTFRSAVGCGMVRAYLPS